MSAPSSDFEAQARRFERRLPRFAAATLRWAREASVWLRWPLAVLLIGGGLLGFLPILGFWMIPLGVILIVQDLPFLRAPVARLFAYVARKWPG
jgi:hypothetical protein